MDAQEARSVSKSQKRCRLEDEQSMKGRHVSKAYGYVWIRILLAFTVSVSVRVLRPPLSTKLVWIRISVRFLRAARGSVRICIRIRTLETCLHLPKTRHGLRDLMHGGLGALAVDLKPLGEHDQQLAQS